MQFGRIRLESYVNFFEAGKDARKSKTRVSLQRQATTALTGKHIYHPTLEQKKKTVDPLNGGHVVQRSATMSPRLPLTTLGNKAPKIKVSTR